MASGVASLLREAEAAGLRLRAEGDSLEIRGPLEFEPLAKSILARKAEVLPYVTGRVVLTQNQCGSCSEWRLSALTELGRGQRVYLCPACFERNRGPR